MKDFFGYVDEFLSTKRGYKIKRLVNPPRCAVCNEVDFVDEGPFCEGCYEKFMGVISALCPICHASKEECICSEFSGIEKVFFLFWYDEQISAKILSKVKYMGDKPSISYFGKLIADKIKSSDKEIKLDAVCYIPRTKKNMREIGYDQSKFLAESISFYLNVPMINCLKRTGASAEQKKLSGVERKRNVRNKYDVCLEKFPLPTGEIPRKVLLIDDIITTGSTIKECSYLLRQLGVRKVYAASVARTPLKRQNRKKKKYRRIKRH